MIDTIKNIAKILVAILPIIVLCFSNHRANLSAKDRSKQFFMPIIALVYMIFLMFIIDPLNDWLLKLISNIPKWIAGLASFDWMPNFFSGILTQISNLLEMILQAINLKFWIFFLSNIIIFLLYLSVKNASVALMLKFVKPEGFLHTRIASHFYEYFAERDIWCIKENYVQTRSFLKVFYYATIVLLLLLMLVSRKFYYEELLTSIFYPVFGIIIVGELYFYLNGLTKREYSENILGEDEDAYRIVNYSLLRKFLRSLFGDKLLSEKTSINNALTYDVTTEEIIYELEKNEDQKIQIFASYFKALNATGFQIDHNYLHSSLDMLNGKSILFNNPFYNDLIPYAFYPMNRALLSHQKVLVVLGRHAIEDDIKAWLEKGIESITNIPFLWNIGILNSETQNDIDIGIITRSDVLNMQVHEANSEFLENVGFFVVIEPSKLISTAQIGLNLIVKQCHNKEEKNIVYCLCDKNCDGLVDAMSHILMTSLTEVSATNKHLGTSSYMCWEADDEYLHHRLVPNISRYLGVGTELSFAALKNQVSKTKWYGGEAFPVTDIRWIDKQYYYDLTKYAGLSTNQQTMDEHFETSHNFWSAEIDKNNYFTVEDEAFNMFEILRDFSTRSTEQGFINVISSEYLLKDYMADNDSIFEADAKAIPYIVADYTRSNRNTILRLILMMSTDTVSVGVLERELSLIGINIFDLKKQLWYELYNCYAEVSDICTLPGDYREAVVEAASRIICLSNKNEVGLDVIQEKEQFNFKLGRMESVYCIDNPAFLSACVAELESAGYVAEDEKGEKYFLGSELSGHIYQKYLPGQFFTFDGKYYEMQYLTADGQVLVRRAADHINGRPTYRQIRKYVVAGVKSSEKIGAQQDISGLKVIKEFADIKVDTPGYYHMEKYNDFETAKKISFEGDTKNGIPQREYHNKEILRIVLPDFGEKLNDNIRYTIALLFNEVFKTLFAENQAYICAVTDDSFITDDTSLKPLTYSIEGNGYELQSNSIYIIEDSQLDLGLTVAVERNLERIFKIIHDYLDWHIETLEISLNPPPPPQPPVIFDDPSDDEADGKKKKKGFKGFIAAIGRGIRKIIDKIKGWFKKKPKKGKEPTDETGVEPEKTDAVVPEDTKTEAEGANTEASETSEKPKRRGIGKIVDKIKGWFKRKPKKEEEVGETPNDETTTEEPADTAGDSDTEATEPTDSPEIAEPAETTETTEDTETHEPIETGETTEPSEDTEVGEVAESSEDTEDAETTETSETTESSDEVVVKEPTETDESVTEETDGVEDIVKKPNCPSDEITYNTENERVIKRGFSTERRPYHERYYMLYGQIDEPTCLDLKGTLDYLSELGMSRNSLKQAREGKNIAEMIEATFKPGKPDARYCDFCGTEIFGVEYETLADGRDRCLSCSRTAIKTGEEFKRIFEDVKRNMESFFGIKINTGIRVEMVNSKTLHKRLGKAFIPTPKADGRILGVAIKDKNGYSLYVENGSPRMASMLTMVHELTHIWQYLNWDDKAIRKKYGKDLYLQVYEGMAKWVEIQYAYLINEPAVAKREEIITSYREDEYGIGFLRYRANYPFSLGTVITKPTPFMDVETPLALEYCQGVVRYVPQGTNPPVDDDTDGNRRRPTPTGEIDPEESAKLDNLEGPIDRTPGDVHMYAYGLLSDEEKVIYDKGLDAINNYEASLELADVSMTMEQASKIFDYIQKDHPEIFWFNYGAKYFVNPTTNFVEKIEFEYCMTIDEALSRQEKIDVAVKPFLESIYDNMSDYEVALRIYENIIKLVDYDTIGLEKQKKSPVVSSAPDDLRSIYGVFVNKKAVCAGYAKATQYLMNLVGIECTYIASDTHAWNIIKLEGDYYHLDTTWGDSSNTDKEKNGSNEIRYDCFCITTKDLLNLKEHSPEDLLPVPECTATKCNYYHRHGLYFESYNYDKVRAIVYDSLKKNKPTVSLKFENSRVYREALRALVDKDDFRTAIKYANLKLNKRSGTSSYSYINDKEKLILSFIFRKD